MNKLFVRIMIAAALTLTWGCSSSDDGDDGSGDGNGTGGNTYRVENVEKAPNWSAGFSMPAGDIQGKPDWRQVDFYMFENTMTAIVHLQREFVEYYSEDDLMVAIVDGEVREIAGLLYEGEEDKPDAVFRMMVPYDSDEGLVDIYYYNAKTNQTYSMTQAFRVQDDTVGSESDFVFNLVDGTDLSLSLPDVLPFTPSADDQVAVFVGDVCCGVASYEPALKTWDVTALNILENGKKGHVRYYSARQKAIYRTGDIIDFSESDEEDVVKKYLNFI